MRDDLHTGMGRHIDGWERAANRGPWSLVFKTIGTLLLLSVILTAVAVPFGLLRGCRRAVGETLAVAHEEFGPRELLRKYVWFKDAAAQLDKKQADIAVYASRLSAMASDYGDTSRKDWDRTDKEQQSVWQAEVAGVKASYNALAAEYNAQMAKFNWRFCEVGGLPPGAIDPLPREFKPYINE